MSVYGVVKVSKFKMMATKSVPSRRQFEKTSGCLDKSDCGAGADCVRIYTTVFKCKCVDDLSDPDEKTGECYGNSSGRTNATDGVISHSQIKEMVLPNRTFNRVQTQEPSEDVNIPLLTLIPLLCSLAVIAAIFMWRRHVRRKISRNGVMAIRNTDGEMLLDRMNNVNKNQTYFQSNGTTSRKHNINEINVDHLKLLERIGEGAFGQVFKGDLYCPLTNEHIQVAVKILKEGASVEVRDEFEKEVEIMSTFDHDNILSLKGIVTSGIDGMPFMVFDFMEYGDLSEVLRSSDSYNRHKRSLSFSKTDLVDFSVQIACGMNYLAAQRFVHRDLATRNCLVGKGMVVKISDFGMSRDVYTNDYYRLEGARMLPVRWMSPEAIKYGRFTRESDIWAYGVVLWEIFSGGKQPYYGHANEEVIHLLDQGILLQRSEDCPSTIYHVMLGCWKQDPKERTPFERLVKHLTDYRDHLIESGHLVQRDLNTPAASTTTKKSTTDSNSMTSQRRGSDKKSGSDSLSSVTKRNKGNNEQTTDGVGGQVIDYNCLADDTEETIMANGCKSFQKSPSYDGIYGQISACIVDIDGEKCFKHFAEVPHSLPGNTRDGDAQNIIDCENLSLAEDQSLSLMNHAKINKSFSPQGAKSADNVEHLNNANRESSLIQLQLDEKKNNTTVPYKNKLIESYSDLDAINPQAIIANSKSKSDLNLDLESLESKLSPQVSPKTNGQNIPLTTTVAWN